MTRSSLSPVPAILLALVTSCLLGVAPLYAAGEDAPTSGTLRLSDLFNTRPGPSGFAAAPGHFDPRGPVLVIPDVSAWRLPPPAPAPTPAPVVAIPEGLDLPRFQPLIILSQKDDRLIESPAFQPRGVANRLTAPRNVFLSIVTENVQLRTEYRLYRYGEGAEAGDLVLTCLHGPGTAEQFELPEGSYRLWRRVWSPSNPAAAREEIYAQQTLAGGNSYAYIAAADAETGTTERLGR